MQGDVSTKSAQQQSKAPLELVTLEKKDMPVLLFVTLRFMHKQSSHKQTNEDTRSLRKTT